MLVGFILVFVGCIDFFAADATCWGIKIIDLNISWFQILKGSIAIPKLSVKWLGWIKDISIFCWWKSWCILVEIHTFGSDSPSPSYFGQIPQQLVTSAYSCRWQSFFGYTHIYIYSRFVVGYTLIFRIYLSPFLLVMCSCVNPRKEFEQHFCWIWYITWQYMTSIFFWVNTLPIGHQAMLYEIFNSVGPVASIRVCRDSVSRKPGDLGTWRFMWPEIRAVAAKP